MADTVGRKPATGRSVRDKCLLRQRQARLFRIGGMEWVFQTGVEYHQIGLVGTGRRHRCEHAAQIDAIDEKRGGGSTVDARRYQDRFVADLQTVSSKVKETDAAARKTRAKRG